MSAPLGSAVHCCLFITTLTGQLAYSWMSASRCATANTQYSSHPPRRPLFLLPLAGRDPAALDPASSSTPASPPLLTLFSLDPPPFPLLPLGGREPRGLIEPCELRPLAGRESPPFLPFALLAVEGLLGLLCSSRFLSFSSSLLIAISARTSGSNEG